MKFNVTRKDIAAGQQSDATHCPIALAVQRKFPTAEVSVFTRIIVNGKTFGFDAETPPAVLARLEAYDEGLGMDPFSFEVMEDD